MPRRKPVGTPEVRGSDGPGADVAALAAVVAAVGAATDAETCARAALEAVREAFGWAYGSYWRVDPRDNRLRFAVESGTTTAKFRQVTLSAAFAEGVGLSGRAWKARDLVFVADLGTMTDCVRAPVAREDGIRSGVCFPSS